jgi:hypothetical protein
MVIVLFSWKASGAFDRSGSGSGDLGSLVLTLLAEGGEQHDATVSGESVGDAATCLTESEAHLEESISQARGERHTSC